MKKANVVLMSSLAILSLGLVSASVFSSEKNVNLVSAYRYPNGDASTYYADVDNTSGLTLLYSLRDINNTRLKYRVGYDNMPGAYTRTDPGTSSGQVTSFYSGTSARYSGNMNREHVWPASRTVGGRGNDPLEDDIHMTRPTLTSDNDSRGNSFFAEGGQGGDRTPWDPANCKNETYRGDSARIIFYCVVADSELSLVDSNSDYTSNHTMGKLSDLLKWNLEYPVTEREKTRNEAAEELQGNRNPFIDHPEYACRIWGNANSTTKDICSRVTATPTGITLSDDEITLKVGETYTLSYTVTPEGAMPSVYWESSYEDVATVNEGLVTAIKAGDTSVSISIDGTSLYDICKVHVKGDQEPTVVSKPGCGGNVATTSTILSTLSLIGISLILVNFFVRKKR